MRATGIIRRVDDLGRIIIPKEIRRLAGISDGTPMEIFYDRDGTVVLKKYITESENENQELVRGSYEIEGNKVYYF